MVAFFPAAICSRLALSKRLPTRRQSAATTSAAYRNTTLYSLFAAHRVTTYPRSVGATGGRAPFCRDQRSRLQQKRRAGRSSAKNGLPAPPRRRVFSPTNRGTGAQVRLDSSWLRPDSPKAIQYRARCVHAFGEDTNTTRKPRLPKRKPGRLMKRYDESKWSGSWSYHDPPRKTGVPLCPL